MLLCLRVHHFAIIDQLEVEFGPGLNVVTGETGAGKSILVSALQLVLGGKARAEVVRTGADSAEVEALFDISGHDRLLSKMGELGLIDGGQLGHLNDGHLNDGQPSDGQPSDGQPSDGQPSDGQPSDGQPSDSQRGDAPVPAIAGPQELVLRRVISKSGRSRAYINGRMASVGQLAELAAGLCDISSQHEHHTLVNPASHIRYLDAFGQLVGQGRLMGDAFHRVTARRAQLQSVENMGRERIEREDLLRFQIQEIEALDLKPDEDLTLTEERDRSRNAERLGQLSGGAEDALYAADDALCQRLARVIHMVEEATGMDPGLTPVCEQLQSAQAHLEDAARELGSYAGTITVDPARLSEIEDRLHALSRLRRKYGDSIEAILAHADRARDELTDLDQNETRLEALEQALTEAKTAAHKLAQLLSARRRKAAKSLGQAITKELASLSMGDAAVRVDVDNAPGQVDELTMGGARLTATGIDRVEFLIATNRGEAPQPLHKVASGGELSRAMLSIKRVLAGVGPGGLYVFDEVDSGVGGAVAEVIGRKVKEVSNHHQVLCITHLPQIAVFADEHFHVCKALSKGRTCSRIVKLDSEAQQEEIARMLGGIKITKSTRAAAREMLQAASETSVQDGQAREAVA